MKKGTAGTRLLVDSLASGAVKILKKKFTIYFMHIPATPGGKKKTVAKLHASRVLKPLVLQDLIEVS